MFTWPALAFPSYSTDFRKHFGLVQIPAKYCTIITILHPNQMFFNENVSNDVNMSNASNITNHMQLQYESK